MLLFGGEKGTHRTRTDAYNGETLRIAETVTKEDLEIAGGTYWQLTVTNLDRANRAQCRLLVELGPPAEPVRGPLSGSIELRDKDSYRFLLGQRHDKCSGGDFYLTVGKTGASFFANNLRQRGLVDLGLGQSSDLTDVRPPAGGYSRFGVPAVSGHTYVSLAKAGEEDCYIILRVTHIEPGQYVRLEYLYTHIPAAR
jgi:hypothetical protein